MRDRTKLLNRVREHPDSTERKQKSTGKEDTTFLIPRGMMVKACGEIKGIHIHYDRNRPKGQQYWRD